MGLFYDICLRGYFISIIFIRLFHTQFHNDEILSALNLSRHSFTFNHHPKGLSIIEIYLYFISCYFFLFY